MPAFTLAHCLHSLSPWHHPPHAGQTASPFFTYLPFRFCKLRQNSATRCGKSALTERHKTFGSKNLATFQGKGRHVLKQMAMRSTVTDRRSCERAQLTVPLVGSHSQLNFYC